MANFTPNELALATALRGPKTSDRKLREQAGLSADQAFAASVSLRTKLGVDPNRETLRDAVRRTWQ